MGSEKIVLQVRKHTQGWQVPSVSWVKAVQYIHNKVDIIYKNFYQTDTKKALLQILLYYLEPIIGNVKPHIEQNNDFNVSRQQNT